MKHAAFEVTNSITKRLKSVMIAIAFFFIAGAIGIYISSFGFLDGLQSINSANHILNLTAQSVEALDTSNQNLENVLTTNNLSDLEFSFEESQKHLKVYVLNSINTAGKRTEVRKFLEQSLDSIFLYEESVKTLFKHLASIPKPRSKEETDKIKSEVLVANQFALDAKEFLRKAQINLNTDTERIFDEIYQDRFKPLFVGITLSAFFFFFVITFGFSTSKKITVAVNNLLGAAEKVIGGNFSYQAPVFDKSELGLLTNTFNRMVVNLREGRANLDYTIDRIRNLQRITAGFSESMTADEVIRVTIDEGFKTIEVSVGAIYLLNDEKNILFIRDHIGTKPEIVERWRNIPINQDIPLAKAVKENRPLFYERLDELITDFPSMKSELGDRPNHSQVALPLSVGNMVLGAIYLTFGTEKKFTDSEKDFLLAISQQCAQALYRSQLYDESRNAIMVRDEFLSIASHELKTPLTPLKLQLQLLSRQLKRGAKELDLDKVLASMENSDRQLNRLSRLIEDLLDVSRITSGKLNLNIEKLNLSKLLGEIIDQYQHQLKSSLSKIDVEIEDGIIINADIMRVEQVIVNILTNAAKYAPGKPIQVTLKRLNKLAQITVTDHGPGVAADNVQRIFQRFERVKENDNVGGLGLGLYICHQIIEAHNGRIYVESELGKGSKFFIELPLIS